MKEIGGYFGLDKFEGKEYYSNLIAVNSGRNALAYLIKTNKIKKLFIPYYLCDSVSDLCLREECEFEYYTVNKEFLPEFNGSLENGQWLYIVNFYGQISNKQVKKYKAKYKNIIFDNVQAFFQKPVKGIDTVYSCRKFFGVPDGGYVSTDKHLNEELPLDTSKNRMQHILGRFEGAASDYYDDFKKNDNKFKMEPIKAMSYLTHNFMSALNYKKIAKTRKNNFKFLHKELKSRNGITPVTPVGPYAYPFYCKNGMELKKILAKENIYVATLWPNVLVSTDPTGKDYSENILPLPCDQRYNTKDMAKIVKEIKRYI